jgi:hypothetical protein
VTSQQRGERVAVSGDGGSNYGRVVGAGHSPASHVR